jgi:hypothetical protein
MLLSLSVPRSDLDPYKFPVQLEWGEGKFHRKQLPVIEADHTTVSSAEAKNAWSFIANPLYVFMTYA